MAHNDFGTFFVFSFNTVGREYIGLNSGTSSIFGVLTFEAAHTHSFHLFNGQKLLNNFKIIERIDEMPRGKCCIHEC
jgi:hypothetical protein